MSLGVDLVPYKYCPLNCVYCEVQSTTHLLTQRLEYIPADEILRELDDFLKSEPELDYITFSGAGEPTLNSGIGTVIAHIKNRYPKYKLALLTNGTLLGDPGLRQEIMACDLILPSLDSATQEGYEAINRPKPGLQVSELISNLKSLRQEYRGNIWLEVFIIAGINDTEQELDALTEAISQIEPDLIQLNALDRPGAEEWVKAAEPKLLQKIQKYLGWRLPIPVQIIAKSAIQPDYSGAGDMFDQIEATLKRRPCTAEDLAVILGTHINEVTKLLRELGSHAKVEAKRENRGVFYLWKQ